MVTMAKVMTIELYKEDGKFKAYIEEENSSGYICAGSSSEEVAQQVAQYIEESFIPIQND